MQQREIGLQKGVAKRQIYDKDTILNIGRVYDKEKMYGRKNIVINASVEDFLANPIGVIEENLNYIISTHNVNIAEMEYLKNYQKGNQDILNKVRSNGDTKINNKHVTNYAWEFVNFKKGYYVGKPIKYVDVNEEETPDIKYFNRYNRNINKASKDLIKYENMLITGIAHTMTIPAKRKVDLEYESPYTYTILDNNDVCVVKSNDIYRSKLFSMCISQIDDGEERYDLYTVYYDYKYLILKNNDGKLLTIEEGNMPVRDCITEYQLNEQRMGVFEPVLNSLNSMNMISSNQLDQLEERVNSYLTFENVDVSSLMSNIDDFRTKRVLAVNTTNPEAPAKIGVINMGSEESTINDKYNKMEQRAYDIIGVPMPTSNTGQGVSGEAQVYGGGWENAQTIASVDTQYIMQFEKEDLEKFIYISKQKSDTKTPNLFASDIEIKYTINKSNNMMVKAQSLKYFINEGFTREQALTYCEITDDPQNDGKLADENYLKNKQFEVDLELYKLEREKEIQNQYTIEQTEEQVQEPNEEDI